MCAKAYREGWGGVVFKTIGPKHYLIDEVSPRFDALTKEAEPFVGFKNMEQIAEHSLEENLADLRKLKKEFPNQVLIASIMGSNEEDWEVLARLVTEAGADMIELNFSCPQMTSHAMGRDGDNGGSKQMLFRHRERFMGTAGTQDHRGIHGCIEGHDEDRRDARHQVVATARPDEGFGLSGHGYSCLHEMNHC